MPRIAQPLSKNCLYCKSDFPLNRHVKIRKYCSTKCRILANNNKRANCRVEKLCIVCQKPFSLQVKTQTCSKNCHYALANANRPNRKTGITTNCLVCQQSEYIPLSIYNKSPTKTFFCCSEHANEYQGRNKIEYSCKVCNKSFKRSPCWEAYGKPQKYCSINCRNADPDHIQRLREINAAQQTSKINKLEQAGYSLLDEIGLLYFAQYLIGNKFCVDAFFYSAGLIVQFDGDYWHGNPDKFPVLSKSQERRSKLDKSQDAYMSKCGYRVLRFWETEIKKEPESVKSKILAALN